MKRKTCYFRWPNFWTVIWIDAEKLHTQNPLDLMDEQRTLFPSFFWMRQALQNVSNQLSSTGYAWSIFKWKSFLIPLVKKASHCSFLTFHIWWFEDVTSGRKEGKKCLVPIQMKWFFFLRFFVECLRFFSFLYHFEFCVFRFLLLWLLVAVLLLVAMIFNDAIKIKAAKFSKTKAHP